MRKLFNKPWFVAALALAALVLVAQSLVDQRKPRPRAGDSVSPEPAVEVVEDAAPVAFDARTIAGALKALELPEVVPDPFAPRTARAVAAPAEPGEKAPDLAETVHLSAIWEQQGSSFILLNDRICGVGDAVGLITIATIEREGIWLSHWRGRDFLRLGQDFTLTTPAAQAANLKTAKHEG